MVEKTVYQSQLEDEEVMAELLEGAATEQEMRESMAHAEAVGAPMETLAERGAQTDVRSAVRSLQEETADLMVPTFAEAIIIKTGFPSLLVRDGTYQKPKLKV